MFFNILLDSRMRFGCLGVQGRMLTRICAWALYLAASTGCTRSGPSAGSEPEPKPEQWGIFSAVVRGMRTGVRWTAELDHGEFTALSPEEVTKAQNDSSQNPAGLLQLVSISRTGAKHFARGLVLGVLHCHGDLCHPTVYDKLEDVPASFDSSRISIPITPETAELDVVLVSQTIAHVTRPARPPRIDLQEVGPASDRESRRGFTWRIEPAGPASIWATVCASEARCGPSDPWRPVRTSGRSRAQRRRDINFELAATDGFQRVHAALVVKGNASLPLDDFGR